MMRYILSNYPLSNGYRAQVRGRFGEVAWGTVSELRQVSFSSFLRRLFAIRCDELYVAFEDESSKALIPIMQILATVTRSRELFLMDENQETTRISRWRAVAAAMGLVSTSCLACVSLIRSRIRMRQLLEEPRLPFHSRGRPGVVYINGNLWFGVKAGGSVGHISGVANAFMDLGHPVQFHSVGGRLLVNEQAEFVPLIAPHMLAVPFETTYYMFDSSCTRQIAKRVASGPKPAFIYQRMSLANISGVRLSRRFQVPLILEYNGSEAWVAKNWGRPLRFHQSALDAEEVCLSHAHLIVTVSNVLAAELQTRGVDRHRIVVYPNCIDPLMFDPARFDIAAISALRGASGFSPDDVVATFIGTFGQWHGVDVLASAIRLMIDRHSEFLDDWRLRFMLIGDGLKMQQVRQILKGAEDGPYVRLLGLVPQRDAPCYLAASDLLLSPHVKNPDGTAFFGSPTKLFEYMAMGRGIVASDLDQLGEVLRPAISLSSGAPAMRDVESAVAILTPPGDVEALIEAIRMLASNRSLRVKLGENARRLALSKYTWVHHTRAILDGLTSVEAKGSEPC